MIVKGTEVKISTTNGGEIVARLVENHRHTYDAVIEVPGGYARIPSFRIKGRLTVVNPWGRDAGLL